MTGIVEFMGNCSNARIAVQTPTGILNRNINSIVVGTDIAGISWDVNTSQLRDFQRPENRAVVGIHTHYTVKSLVVKPAAGRNRRRHPHVAVKGRIPTRPAYPLQIHIACTGNTAHSVETITAVIGSAILM